MSNPELLIAHNQLPQKIIEMLSEKFNVQIVDKSMSSSTKQDILVNIPGKFGLLISSRTEVDEDVINAAGSNLKVVSTTSMGYDKVDTNALKKRGILFGNTASATTQRVAELTIGLLIATARNFFEANRQMKTGNWSVPLGSGLQNSVVGIIGCGNIGICVAEMLSAFKLRRLLYTSRKPKPEVEHFGGQKVSVDDVAQCSDFIILATVLVPETKFIINRERLAIMKPNAVIINVGRGELIDQDALIDALREKRIRGVGLDVMTPEPLPLNNPLMTMENAVLLPHIAGRNTMEAEMEKALLAAENIFAVFNDQPMPCEVKV